MKKKLFRTAKEFCGGRSLTSQMIKMGEKTTLIGISIDFSKTRFPDYQGPQEEPEAKPEPQYKNTAKVAESHADQDHKKKLGLSEIERARKTIEEVREEEEFDNFAFQDEIVATIDRIVVEEDVGEVTLAHTWDMARGEVEGYIEKGNYRDALVYMDKFLGIAEEAGEELPGNFYQQFKRALNQACAETWSIIDEGNLDYASKMLDGIEQYAQISGVPSLWLVMNLQDHYHREWKKANPEKDLFQLEFEFYKKNI